VTSFNLSLNHYLELPDDVFRQLREQIYNRSGMFFADSSKYLLQKRLSPRARELNFDSFQKYFYFLQYDPRAEAEYDQIFDLVTTNETYFFREPAQLAAFTEEIVPEILSRKAVRKAPIRSTADTPAPNRWPRHHRSQPFRRRVRAGNLDVPVIVRSQWNVWRGVPEVRTQLRRKLDATVRKERFRCWE